MSFIHFLPPFCVLSSTGRSFTLYTFGGYFHRLTFFVPRDYRVVLFIQETQYSKTFDKIPAPDIAISMGCDVGCPYIGRAFDDNWGLQDPTGQSDEVFIEVIKEIENRISQL